MRFDTDFSKSVKEKLVAVIRRRIGSMPKAIPTTEKKSDKHSCLGLDHDDLKILSCFNGSKDKNRSFGGISDQLNMPMEQVKQRIEQLGNDGLVIKKKREDGRILVRLTSIGVKASNTL